MIDFHNHLLPGVDDGAADLGQTRTALEAYRAQGATAVIATPHFQASLLQRPERAHAALAAIDAAWEAARELAAAEFPGVRLERGVELMLDTPEPELDDPRLRLAGTRFALVEFPFMTVPPHASNVLFELQMRGWTPVLAHPERYLGGEPGAVDEWKRVGALLQVNAGSLLGKYGPGPRAEGWRLVERGAVDYLGSDFHARGTLHLAGGRAALEAAGGAEQALLLLETNPGRLLEGLPPIPVPPLGPPRSLLGRLLGRR